MDTLKIVENRWNINSRPFFVFTNSGCASSLPQGAWIPAWYLPLERRVREKYRILFSVANRYPRFIVSRGSAGHGIGFILLLALARVPHSSGAALHKFPCRCDAISHRRRDRNRIYIYIYTRIQKQDITGIDISFRSNSFVSLLKNCFKTIFHGKNIWIIFDRNNRSNGSFEN